MNKPALTPLLSRRETLAVLGGAAAAVAFALPAVAAHTRRDDPLFSISLAQWSLHRALRDENRLDHLDFPKKAKELGFEAVEYVNSFFKDKAQGSAYLAEMKKRCTDLGVRSLLIMCDGEGDLGDPDAAARTAAVENHRKWCEAAAALSCHSIRVNAASQGAFEEQQKLAADGLRRLCEIGETHGVNVIVENHGGLSSNGAWLAGVMRLVDHPRCGTLPDFGNFRIKSDEEYDRYKGVEELMPFAKAVSAKSYGFDDKGDETTIDYRRMMKIVIAAGYRGHVGVEYEGDKHSEEEGIRLTRELLERICDEIQP